MWLYLFDVDGTLVHSGGAGLRSIQSAFREVLGIALPDDILARVPLHGRTDPMILQDVVEVAGVAQPQRETAATQIMAHYLAVLPGEMQNSPGRRVYPGVPELLAALHTEPAVDLGLLTGNVEGGARAKLAPFDLNHFFPTGGFGSDSGDRREVARIAHRQCERHFGKSFPAERVVVVGDTAADVDCARAAGFHAVAVATGIVPADELHRENPDLVFEDFADTDAVVSALFARFPTEGSC